ncbi:Putative beta-lactamase-like 1 [Geodia barretti]|uniref:Beta-lactamase-like 1 n=1 Tax=Geodia barretti TaxID=519541 RepID=A0AA35W8C0_GEOBA|nr:Putative beta-lactamase-like 1 [Geodia barretti]
MFLNAETARFRFLLSFGASDPNCPPHPIPVPLSSPLPPIIQTSFSRLEQLIDGSLNTTSVPGISASLVYMGSEIWSKGFGVKSKTGPSTPPDHHTIFRIGSVSKVFAALVMYQLYDRGLVKSLDDPLSDYCPRFSMLNPFNSRNITLRQIASQMSGLPREAPCVEPAAREVRDGVNICPLTTDEILASLSNESLIFPTWTVPSYSNLGFALLGQCLVEGVFPGMTYEDYVIKNILQPLQLTNTGFNITDNVKSKMAVGYEPDGSVAPLYDLGWESPAGQMFSTTADLNTLAAFFTSADGENGSSPVHPEVLSGDLRREIQLQVYVNRDQRTGFGTPWEIRFQANYTVLRKGGNIDGYSALFSYIPELKLGLNILWSGSIDEFFTSNSAYDIIIPAFVEYLLTAQPPYPYPPNPKACGLCEYEGVYVYRDTELEVRSEKNQLLLDGSGGAAVLAYKEPLRFQISFPDNLQPCLAAELLAERRAFVVFQPPTTSSLCPGFTIPGSFPGVEFQRKQ